MLSVIGSLLGFASSAAPAVADHFRAKQDQKFELAKMEKMAQLRPRDSIRNTACTKRKLTIMNTPDWLHTTLVSIVVLELLAVYNALSVQ